MIPIASPIIVLALKLPWETLVVTALVTGFGNMLFNTLWETTLQQHIPPASLSRVSAYDWFGSLLGQPLGLALAGVAAAGIGMSRTLWIAATVDLVAVAAILAAPSVRHLQRLDEPSLERSAPSHLMPGADYCNRRDVQESNAATSPNAKRLQNGRHPQKPAAS